MTKRSENRDDFQKIPQAVGAMAKEFSRGEISDRHRHTRAQLLYAVKGVFEVTTSDSLFLVPPQHALWLPAGINHEVRFRTKSSVRTLYIHKNSIPARAANEACVVHVSPLLRELILRLVELPVHYKGDSQASRIAALALEELDWEPDDHLQLPLPEDMRLERIHEALRQNPGDNQTLEQWAKKVGASSRTLARLFQNEFGTSFLNWRHQLRVIAALPKLAAGEPVINVALDLGYETPGAFTQMFHRITGVLPSKYTGESN